MNSSLLSHAPVVRRYLALLSFSILFSGSMLGMASAQVVIDSGEPTVLSIVRADANPTSAATVSWTVTFDSPAPMAGVDALDFVLVEAGGVTGASITGITGEDAGPYTVTADTGEGSGTLGLNLVDNDTIVSSSAVPLGGTGLGNGDFTGEVYDIGTAPTCPEGYTQEGENCVSDAEPVPPTACDEGHTLVGEDCVATPVDPSCPEDLRLQEDVTETTDGCISIAPTSPDVCSGGAVVSEGECVVIASTPGGTPEAPTCSFPGSVYRADLDKCVYAPSVPIAPSCAEGLVMNGGMCYDVDELTCPEGYTYDDATNKCNGPAEEPGCPVGTEPQAELCAFVSVSPTVCPAGSSLTSGVCLPNPIPTCTAGFHLENNVCVADPVVPPVTTNSGGSSSGGGGGGGGGSFTPFVPPATTTASTTPPAPQPQGQVLGASTSCYQFTRTLSLGMQGEDVTELQEILIAGGFLVVDAPTGYFGAMTMAAVKAFQAKNGLEQVGVVGPKTRALLNACGSNPNQASIDELTKKLNALLDQIRQLMSAQSV